MISLVFLKFEMQYIFVIYRKNGDQVFGILFVK